MHGCTPFLTQHACATSLPQFSDTVFAVVVGDTTLRFVAVLAKVGGAHCPACSQMGPGPGLSRLFRRVHQDMQADALILQLPRCALGHALARAPTLPSNPPLMQIAILLAAPADSTVQVRRRGHLLTCAEFVSQLYRMLPPAPLWYAFYTAQAAVPALLRTGLSGAYLLVRAAAG